MTIFNEQSVGRRVISKTYGKGTVAELYLESNSPHLRVDFDDGDYWFFDLNGIYDGIISKPEVDIVPIVDAKAKQGSPDARRIVAMLASEYRRLSYKMNNYRGQDSTSLHAMESQSAKLYLKAKQLLGENNERI